jgi:hypothetical protein
LWSLNGFAHDLVCGFRRGKNESFSSGVSRIIYEFAKPLRAHATLLAKSQEAFSV